MVNLEAVVNDIRDQLRELYLKDRHAVWHHPFVAFIGPSGVSIIEGAKSEENIIGWMAQNRHVVQGVVVGRMVVRYSQTLKDLQGNPQVLERGILVSGRMLSNSQTYVTITPCREHTDLRTPIGDTTDNAEPQGALPEIAKMDSPDKVHKIVTDGGYVKGFVSVAFGEEKVFDSRRGDRCALDPLIQGVIDAPEVPNAGV